MRLLRSRRDHNITRKIAAEQAIDWCTIELQILERGSVSEEEVRRTLTHLRALQCELAAAIDDLAKCRRDIGVTRNLIRSKGLPIPCLVLPEAARKTVVNSGGETPSEASSVVTESDESDESEDFRETQEQE
jgi:hypothetical protein